MEEGRQSTTIIQQESRKRKSYKTPSNYNFNCECRKNFTLEKHFNAHRKKEHKESQRSPDNIVNNPDSKNCPLCDFSAKFRDEMIKHHELIHDISFIEEKHTFSSQADFLLWKRKIESDTNSKFINIGTRTCSKYKITYFNCHRSGNYVTKGKGLRSLKTKGSIKINSFCPSRMKLQCFENDGTCIIYFSSTHVGHQNELKYLTPILAEREENNSLIIAESESNNNCESDIFELSESEPSCKDLNVRKKKFQNAILKTLGTISSSEEMEILEKYYSQISPLLAAIKDKNLSFQEKQSFVAIKDIVPQRRFVFTKEKRPTKTKNN